MLRVCVGKVVWFKISDEVVTSIRCVSAYDIVLNQNIDVLFAITHGGSDLQGENCIQLYLKMFKICLYAGRALQGEHGATEIKYILPTYQPLLMRTTAEYWRSLQVYYLTLK